MVDIDMNWVGGRLGVRSGLGATELDALQRLPVIMREFDPGQYLLREGDRPKHCSCLKSGFVYRHKIVGDGGRQIVSVHVPGDFVDAQNIMLAQSDHNIQALTDAVMYLIPIDELIAVAMAHPAIIKALWRETLIEAAIMREWVANVGRRDARARTAHMLCEMAVRRETAGLGPRETFDLPMTQEQLGDALGLTAVHVNRTLKTLETDGLITRNKRSVTVANWRELRSVGDFTTNYLHLPGAPGLPTT
ncbi:Crp/Fnr family transcriptional regulator [Sphingomonas sp. PB4P5]|uniref:Crp/Fnr family transcriptional regulator n=1 Tax=Parasphingomonas puruogangriensis TaxID=3096155 RepID=UPI002FCA5091